MVLIWWGLGLAWGAGLLGALGFLVLYGSPRRYLDRTMSWHLFWTAIIGGLQYAGKLLSGWSLIPLLIVDWISVGIMYWRVGLLVATRRRHFVKKRDYKREPPSE